MSSPVTFDRGATYYGPVNTIDTSDLRGIGLEGQIRVWDRDDSTSETAQVRYNKQVIGICVRNNASIALLPGRICVWKAANYGKRVDGYGTTTAAHVAGVVDDRLPSAGVRNGDLFWLIVKGPCLVRQALSNLAADVAMNDWLYTITAATSQSTTAGRFTRYVGTFAAADTTDGSAFNIQKNGIGWAISTSLTSNTNGNVLVDLDLF